MIKNFHKNLVLGMETVRRINLVDSEKNFLEFLSISAIIIISASVFSLTALIGSSKNITFLTTQAEITNSTGAILTPPTPEETIQNNMIQNLYARLPIVQNSFIIDFDFSTDTFRVILTQPFDTSRTNFDTWKSNNYPNLQLTHFSFLQFTPNHSGPFLLTALPFYSDVGKTITFDTLFFDTNGAGSIDTVYFGLSDCSVAQASSGNSEFERHLAKFFGFSFNPGSGTGSVASVNLANGCSDTSGNSPWTNFQSAGTINLSNFTGTSKLLSVTKSTHNKILRVKWNVDITNSFISTNFQTLNYYFMAKDTSGIWNTGTSVAKWAYADNINLKQAGVSGKKPGDCDGDGSVDLFDYGFLARSFGKSSGEPDYDARCDFKTDNTIDLFDYGILAINFGK